MSKLSRNILYNLTGQSLLLALSFVATRVTYRQLGDEALGLIYAGYMLNTVLVSALVAGLSRTVVREIAHNLKHNAPYVDALIRTANLLFWAAYALFVLFTWLLIPWIVEHWLNIHTMDITLAIRSMRMMMAGSLLGIVTPFYSAIAYGNENTGISNIADVTTAVLRQIGTLIVISLGADLFMTTAWIAFSFFVALPIYWVGLQRFVASKVLFSFGWSRQVLRESAGFASGMLLVSMTNVIQGQLDKIVISRLLPVGVFGYYTFASNTAQRAGAVRSAIGMAAMPSFSAQVATGDLDALRAQYFKVQDLLSIATVPLYALVAFSFPILLQLIFSPAVAASLGPTAALLVFATFLSSIISGAYNLAIAQGRSRLIAQTSLVALAISIPVSILLISWFGLAGAGFSLIVYWLYWFIDLMPRVYRQCLDLSSREWFGYLSRLLLATAATYGIGWAVLQTWNPSSIPAILISYMVATCVYAVVAYFLLSTASKQTLYRLLIALTQWRFPFAFTR